MSILGRGPLGFRGWLCISGLLIFLAGSSLGFLAGAYLGPEPSREEPFVEPAAQLSPAILHVSNEEIYKRLRLGEGQRTRVDGILASHFQNLQRIRREREDLGRKVEEDLLSLLDEGQREDMRQIIRQINLSGVEERVSQKVHYYKRELKLTAKQEEEVYPIFLADQLDKDECMRDCGRRAARDELRQRFAKMNEERAGKLRPILTEAQWTTFRELEAKKQSWTSSPGDGPFKRGSGGPRPSRDREPEAAGNRPATP